MATRSNIAIQIEKDKFKKVYCHWDGYPAYNGRVLFENYISKEKIEELLSYGDISVLAGKLEPEEGMEHNFSNSQEGVTVFYNRDRGDDNTEAREVTKKELLNALDYVDYIYIFTLDNEWVFYNSIKGDPINLQKHLQNIEDKL